MEFIARILGVSLPVLRNSPITFTALSISMVFARKVVRFVRPAVLSRCLVPPRTSTPGGALPIASFPSMTPVRSAHTSTSASSTIPESHTSKPSSFANNDLLNLGQPGQQSGEGPEEPHTLSGVPTEKLVSSVRELLQQQGAKAPMSSLEELFKALADNREFDAALSLLKEVRAVGIKPSDVLYSNVVRSGRRALRMRELRQLFGEEYNNGGRATLSPTQGSEEEAPANLSTMEPSPVFGSIKEVLELMTQDGAQLTPAFYDDLAYGLAYGNQGGLLVNIAVTMEKRGMQPSNYYYNKMLYTLPRCGLSDRADVLFSRMVLNNLADQSAYTVRIGSLVFLGRVPEAETVYKDMAKLYGLNDVACNTIINGYLANRRVDDALTVLETMKASKDYRPTGVTANTFVSYYYSTGDLVSAAGVLEYFATALGYPTTSRDYANLFKLFARHDQPRALRLLETLKGRPDLCDVDVYNAVLSCMLDRHIPLSFRLRISETLVPVPLAIEGSGLAALLINATQEFRQLVARMEKEGVAPNATTYDLVMRALRARKDHDAVIQVFSQVPFPTLQNNHRNHHLASVIAKGDVDTARAVMKTMNERRQAIFDYNWDALVELGVEMPAGRVRLPRRRPADDKFRGGAASSINGHGDAAHGKSFVTGNGLFKGSRRDSGARWQAGGADRT